MKGYTADQIRGAEAPLLAAGEPLMQRAADGLAAAIGEVVGESAAILVLVGPGDNGGDALFAAATLAEQGHDVKLARAGDRVHAAGFEAALESGADETDDPVGFAEDADVIVDGLLGTGSTPPLRGSARDLVAALLPLVGALDDGEEDGPLVVAVDIPSGIDASTGAAPDDVVLPADVTVTFGGVKAGLLVEPGADYAGEIRLIDIGLDLSRATQVVDR